MSTWQSEQPTPHVSKPLPTNFVYSIKEKSPVGAHIIYLPYIKNPHPEPITNTVQKARYSLKRDRQLYQRQRTAGLPRQTAMLSVYDWQSFRIGKQLNRYIQVYLKIMSWLAMSSYGSSLKMLNSVYEGHWIRNGARLKGLYLRQDPPKDQGLEHNRHLWIFGPSGKGKTSIVEYLYPGHFKKRSDPDWLGWDPNYEPHKVVLINDLDIIGMSRLGCDHLKELCDPQGFNANKKYAGGEVINPSLVIVTSNFTISECLQPDMPGRHEQTIALRRRLRMVSADEFIREQGLMLCSPSEVEFAKQSGLWNDHKYKCLFKPIQYANDTDYHWLKADMEDTDPEEKTNQ